MRELKILPNQMDLIDSAADLILTTAAAAIQERGRFSIALSGGSTPLSLYEHLAREGPKNDLDWSKVEFFWGDERSVPPDHPQSNYYQANLTLLQPRRISKHNIHRIQGELDPAKAAEDYQMELLNYFKVPLPHFDLILLGMGADGHTASLFPGTKAFESPQDFELVAANHVPQHETWRITFTAKLINAARCILFLVSGQSKSDILFDVLQNPETRTHFPAQTIQPKDGRLVWLVDQEAGSRITTASFDVPDP